MFPGVARELLFRRLGRLSDAVVLHEHLLVHGGGSDVGLYAPRELVDPRFVHAAERVRHGAEIVLGHIEPFPEEFDGDLNEIFVADAETKVVDASCDFCAHEIDVGGMEEQWVQFGLTVAREQQAPVDVLGELRGGVHVRRFIVRGPNFGRAPTYLQTSC